MFIADLHIHSRYSRATARNLDPENLWAAAQRKGLDLLGSGDITHPAWLEELSEKLVPCGPGVYELRPELAAGLLDMVPGPCQRPVRFVLSGEISSIYKRHGKTRKVHNLVLLPDLEAAGRLQQRLGRLGNITSDGRPILGLDSRDLLELCLEVSPRAIFIPAHIWTPWFSLFGSKSGFDALEECFDDLSGQVHALETGLSSDPAMNWRLSALDRFALVSHSDAHSPAKLAREADLFEGPVEYDTLYKALAQPGGQGLAGTLEFYPDEGKYHLDGHRKCEVRLTPAETRRNAGRCPVCGQLVTVGVLSRVEDLADRPEGTRPDGAKVFESIVPLPEVVAEVLGQGPSTKKVAGLVEELLHQVGPELYILRQAEPDQLARVGGELLAEAVRRVRSGQVHTEGGFDGQFGVVRIFREDERQRLTGQHGFWQLKAAPRKKDQRPDPLPARAAPGQWLEPLDPAQEGLNAQQQEAVNLRGSHLLVRAGPGAGKTRVLVQRAVSLIEEGLAPEAMLLVTFTRKAAAEMAQRLVELSPAAARLEVGTFHSLGLKVISQAQDSEPLVLDEDQRLGLIRPLAKRAGLSAAEAGLALSRAKQELGSPADPMLAGLLADYQQALEDAGALDLDDLVRRAALLLAQNQGLAAEWGGRFAHILVDEYQDVNPVQVALLKALCGPQGRVMAIGDPDQAIYGFRGARRELFARFGRDFPGAVQLGLEFNYRNAGPILAAAQGLLSVEPDPGRHDLTSLAGPGPMVVSCALANAQAEAQWVAERLVKLLGGLDSRQVEAGQDGGAGPGYGAGEVAVLYRLHAQAPPLVEALQRAGVPMQVAAQEPLAETDPLDFKAQRVSLLSLHAAKGLEFSVVFIVGLEERLLPFQPPGKEPAEEAEERRLLYVGMTRAKERLFLSRAARRSLYGQTYEATASPFLADIPQDLLKQVKPARRRRKARQLEMFG